jgi:CBS domain-containing protein
MRTKGADAEAMEVRDGMSGVVLTLGCGHTLREAAAKMTEREVGAAVVVDEELPGPGVLSERDILISVGRGEDPDAERVADHFSDKVISASPDWSLERAAMEMSRRHIRHLVVVEGGELVGVLSMRDIMRVWTSDGATSGMTSPESEAATA